MTSLTTKLIACLSLALVGCDSVKPKAMQPACTRDTAERRAAWIVECAKAANPLSDEEGEDLVAQCEVTAARLFCELELKQWNGVARVWERVGT